MEKLRVASVLAYVVCCTSPASVECTSTLRLYLKDGLSRSPGHAAYYVEVSGWKTQACVGTLHHPWLSGLRLRLRQMCTALELFCRMHRLLYHHYWHWPHMVVHHGRLHPLVRH